MRARPAAAEPFNALSPKDEQLALNTTDNLQCKLT
jgi:hypothetical protein